MMHQLFAIPACVIIGLVSAGGAIAASWNEAVEGDLSNAGLFPSVLTLTLGVNPVRGNFGSPGMPDRDYLALTAPPGSMLSEVRYGDGFSIDDARSFIGVQAGSVMTVLPTTSTPEALLGYAHVQISAVGTDFLPEIGDGYGAIGFNGPLTAGAYTFWIQETSGRPGSFSWDFILTAVPEPEIYAMFLVGLGFVCAMGRRRKAD